jgi:hypothetical protein
MNFGLKKTIVVKGERLAVRVAAEDACVFSFTHPGVHGDFVDLDTGRKFRRCGKHQRWKAPRAEDNVFYREMRGFRVVGAGRPKKRQETRTLTLEEYVRLLDEGKKL